MDLSWCIMCDNRIEDDELTMVDSNNSLYCSQECKSKDTTKSLLSPKSSPANNLFTSTTNNTKNWNTLLTKNKSTAKHLQYKSTAPTTTYPWIPLYRKRHNYLLNTAKRCCQPTVAGSPVTATAILSSSLIR